MKSYSELVQKSFAFIFEMRNAIGKVEFRQNMPRWRARRFAICITSCVDLEELAHLVIEAPEDAALFLNQILFLLEEFKDDIGSLPGLPEISTMLNSEINAAGHALICFYDVIEVTNPGRTIIPRG